MPNLAPKMAGSSLPYSTRVRPPVAPAVVTSTTAIGPHHLFGDKFGVPEESEMMEAHLLGDSHAVEERFILGDVVGAGEKLSYNT